MEVGNDVLAAAARYRGLMSVYEIKEVCDNTDAVLLELANFLAKLVKSLGHPHLLDRRGS